MARLVDGIRFTGSVGNMSAYQLKGTDTIVVRSKGGASKNQIKTSPAFRLTRENNSEWAFCARAGSHIRDTLRYVRHLADYRFVPVLNKLAKHVQLMDTTNNRGERKISFAEHKSLLDGFNLNRKYTFDNIVRHPLNYSVDSLTGTVRIQLPNLIPGINLHLPWQFPVYRFVVSLGILDDSQYLVKANDNGLVEHVYSGWQMAKSPYAGEQLELTAGRILTETETMVLAVGIEMGSPLTNTLIVPEKKAGAAKILGVA